MNTIVVGYDDTPGSQRALERAAALGKALGSKLVVISVTPAIVGTDGSGTPIDQPTDHSEKHAEELAAARGYLEGQGISDADYQATVGEPPDAIVRLADERQADMIVVGVREHGMINRLLGASVSDAVSHHAHCDVLIVHPPQE
jgi:nucleotide-binding universal stress UspA family protein